MSKKEKDLGQKLGRYPQLIKGKVSVKLRELRREHFCRGSISQLSFF